MQESTEREPPHPAAAVSNLSFDFAGFQRARANQGADLVRANAAALFSSDEEEASDALSSEDEDENEATRRQRSAERAEGTGRDRRSRSRSWDRRPDNDPSKSKPKSKKHKRDKEKKRKRKRSRSRSKDRKRPREVPAEVLRPLLTLRPDERRSGVARWAPAAAQGSAVQPALHDVWFVDTQPDRDNAFFGRLHPSDVPRYRREVAPEGVGGRRADPRGKRPEAVAFGMVVEYKYVGCSRENRVFLFFFFSSHVFVSLAKNDGN